MADFGMPGEPPRPGGGIVMSGRGPRAVGGSAPPPRVGPTPPLAQRRPLAWAFQVEPTPNNKQLEKKNSLPRGKGVGLWGTRNPVPLTLFIETTKSSASVATPGLHYS